MGLWEESTAEEKSQKCKILIRNSEKMPELQIKFSCPFYFSWVSETGFHINPCIRPWMWNIKPEACRWLWVLVVTRTVYLQQRMELICSVYGIAQTQFVEFISKARRMGVCRPRLWRVSRLKSKEPCSKTTPAGSASKELIRRPVPKSMFSPDQTLTVL